ncbi:AIPR family protein [Bordetella hinzii]|uniref:AIPR family protein n=1 Tax=Bordetella hinzii TaxID=103855 RepID=UPI000459744D|nr:AIPR family protein [Bordetella hinzii]KCB52926.1 AIPR protein [Bordetella hinzii 1277]MCJ9708827.1 AIPR family protein [Bordetella hinzii]
MATVQPWQTTFASREDLSRYGDNALGLFALGLRFGIDDLESIASDSITDGSDDKKCDLIYIDEDEGFAVVSQCYWSTRSRESAPANKASDLNTAMAWLLERPIKDLPDRIVSSAKQLRAGIKEGTIKTLHVWYVHNCPASQNVEKELGAVEGAASTILRQHFKSYPVQVHVLEVGKEKFHEWHTETLSPILVNETFKIKVGAAFEVEGPDWRSLVTAIPARFLHRIYKKHKTQLFSANVRDYLGSRSTDSNINNGIKKTAEADAHNFWVFNNGLTVLVNSYSWTSTGTGGEIEIQGMSIVNGAQTTGALGSLKKSPPVEALVQVRFVETNNQPLVLNIVQFNNSQNKVTASDFRSTDKFQKSLKEQIARIPNAEYEGGRRGGFGDTIKRRPNLLPSYTVGQSLAALHGDPVTAYNHKANIWVNDSLYSRFFNEDTTGQHIVFAYSLLRAVEDKKLELMTKARKGDDSLTKSEQTQLSFFRKRGSIFLLVSAIASCLEIFLDRRISNLFKVSFPEKTSPRDAQRLWAAIVDVAVPLSSQLEEAINDGLKSSERVKLVVERFRSLNEAIADANRSKYSSFVSKVVIR